MTAVVQDGKSFRTEVTQDRFDCICVGESNVRPETEPVLGCVVLFSSPVVGGRIALDWLLPGETIDNGLHVAAECKRGERQKHRGTQLKNCQCYRIIDDPFKGKLTKSNLISSRTSSVCESYTVATNQPKHERTSKKTFSENNNS